MINDRCYCVATHSDYKVQIEFKALTRRHRIRSPKVKLRGHMDTVARIIHTVAKFVTFNYQNKDFSTIRDDNRRRVVSFGIQLDLIYSVLNQIQRNTEGECVMLVTTATKLYTFLCQSTIELYSNVEFA